MSSVSLLATFLIEIGDAMVDGNSGGVMHWLYTNAPAAWISAAVATVTCIVLIRFRKRPRRAVFREIGNSSLVRIWPGVRPKISMAFEDRPIKELGQVEGEIFNEGSETIQHPTIILGLPESSIVLDVSVNPAELEGQSTTDGSKVRIRLPYLNPVGDHSQIVKVLVLVDGETEPLSVSGGGEGWSVRFVPLVNPRRERYLLMALGFLGAVALLVAYLYGAYIERHYGIGINEVSWRSFIYNSPVLIVMGTLLLLFMKTFSRIMDRKLLRIGRSFR
jgi:hypothetical protein